MSLKSLGRLAIMTALATSAFGAAACGSSSGGGKKSSSDAGSDASTAGHSDAGGGGGGGSDAGQASGGGAPKPIMCSGSQTACETVQVPGFGYLDPCCDDAHDNVCGLKITMGLPTGCYQAKAPGVASTQCDDFLDLIDQKKDGIFETKILNIPVKMPGCCTPEGMCGVSMDKIALPTTTFALGIGCVSLDKLAGAMNASDAGVSGDSGAPADPLASPILPFCNPTDGKAPTSGTVPGVPKFICGCGEGKLQVAGALPCLNNLAEAVCGAADVTDAELAMFPPSLCGCLEPDGGVAANPGGCLPNLDKNTCGTAH